MVKIKQQRGIALITVILIVTLIIIATISMTAHQQLDIRRTVNELNHSQALVYLRGAEYLSMSVLYEDFRKNKIDSLDEDWATVLPPFPVDGGSIGGVLEDLSGKFNINNLVDGKGKRSKIDYERFKRLLTNLKLNIEIADAVVDWIDKDDTPLPGGAEEGFYLSKDKQAYRTPNQLIASTTELLRIKGINFKVYKKLKPYITALPERNKINVNTADKEVLKMIAAQVTDSNAEELIKARDKKGYKNIGAFIQQQALSGLDKKELVDLDVKSNFFLLSSTAIIGQLEIKMESILKRDDKKGKVVVIVRSQGGL
ncbi:MAG: type II secretion system minor pseudopilin GspK [Gammaproteobacteria bacterium]